MPRERPERMGGGNRSAGRKPIWKFESDQLGSICIDLVNRLEPSPLAGLQGERTKTSARKLVNFKAGRIVLSEVTSLPCH